MTNRLHDFLDPSTFEEKFVETYDNGETLNGEPLLNQRVAYRFTVPAVDYHRFVDQKAEVSEVHFEALTDEHFEIEHEFDSKPIEGNN